MTTTPILCDFVAPELAPRLLQDEVNAYAAWVFAKAECIRRGVTSPAEADEVYAFMRSLFEHFAADSSSIARRSLLALPSGGLPIPPAIFDDAGEALAADLEVSLYRDLVTHHRNPEGESLDERLALNDALALRAFERIYAGSEAPPRDLIHVTSTGIGVPGVAQAFASGRGWVATRTTHCHQMMCRAAVPAMRMGAGFLRPGERVDIVHTELLSVHQRALEPTPVSIVAQSLFADGLVKYSVVDGDDARAAGGPGLEILHLDERLLAGTLDAMLWRIRGGQLRHALDPTIPRAIRRNIAPFVEGLCAAVGVDFARRRDDLVYAIHPGGARILDAVRDGLGIDEDKLRTSRALLRERGNTSSAGLPLVLKAIAEDDAVADGALVLAVTFGPGITVSGGVLRKVAG